jgi:hypothetical protein
LRSTAFELRRAEDIDPAFQALKGTAQALYVPATPVALVNRIRINTLALAAHVPTTVRAYVEAGGRVELAAHVGPRRRFRRQNTAWSEADRMMTAHWGKADLISGYSKQPLLTQTDP